jgi:hypothetical protein
MQNAAWKGIWVHTGCGIHGVSTSGREPDGL